MEEARRLRLICSTKTARPTAPHRIDRLCPQKPLVNGRLGATLRAGARARQPHTSRERGGLVAGEIPYPPSPVAQPWPQPPDDDRHARGFCASVVAPCQHCRAGRHCSPPLVARPSVPLGGRAARLYQRGSGSEAELAAPRADCPLRSLDTRGWIVRPIECEWVLPRLRSPPCVARGAMPQPA